MGTNFEKNTENNEAGLLNIYVLTMREIFCMCMHKAGVITRDGKKIARPGGTIKTAIRKEYGINYYKAVLEADNRGPYYNDRIRTLYKQIDAGDLFESNGYDREITAPLIEYAGYKGRIDELNDFFHKCDISSIPTETLRGFDPLVKEGLSAFVSQLPELVPELVALDTEAGADSDGSEVIPVSLKVLYMTNPFGLLRFPVEGVLTPGEEDTFQFEANDNSLQFKMGAITNVKIRQDNTPNDTWIKVSYENGSITEEANFAQFAGTNDADEYYALIYPADLLKIFPLSNSPDR